MGQQRIRPEVRDPASTSLDSQQRHPRYRCELLLLTPPQPPILLGDDLQRVEIDRRIAQPAREMETRGVCAGPAGNLDIHETAARPLGRGFQVLGVGGEARTYEFGTWMPLSDAHTLYESVR